MTDALYRPHILDHARHPRHKGTVSDATHIAREANASCGDVCVMSLRLEAHDGKLARIMFDGQGCALSTAAASLLCESLEGELSPALTDGQFLQLLGVEVTSGRLDCALLPLRALRKALDT